MCSIRTLPVTCTCLALYKNPSKNKYLPCVQLGHFLHYPILFPSIVCENWICGFRLPLMDHLSCYHRIFIWCFIAFPILSIHVQQHKCLVISTLLPPYLLNMYPYLDLTFIQQPSIQPVTEIALFCDFLYSYTFLFQHYFYLPWKPCGNFWVFSLPGTALLPKSLHKYQRTLGTSSVMPSLLTVLRNLDHYLFYSLQFSLSFYMPRVFLPHSFLMLSSVLYALSLPVIILEDRSV